MGLLFSCPLATYNDLENGFESVIVKSINFGDDEFRTPVRSISFKGQYSEPAIMLSVGSGRMLLEKSVSFKARETESLSSIKAPLSQEKNILITSTSNESEEMDNLSPRSDRIVGNVPQYTVLDSSNPKHEAAIKLQKVYKSFRTRRKLADCAVLIEQSWWKLLDFAELKHSSISFFDLKKHESAISRWSRARTRAAKVGKGLSKNDKAQKLALQHWLEAIDPRHRYGHNLHFYYVKWLHSQSKEPFFYWLDIGEGKEVNLEKCPRSKLQQQCIKYLGPMERKAYEVVVKDGKFFYKHGGELLDTAGEPTDSKWIFVLSTSRTLYVGKKKKGTFQHSSFLAGGATLTAGRLVVEQGSLKAVWPHSGHYRPTPENFLDFLSFLRESNVDLTNVKMDSDNEEEEYLTKKRSFHVRSDSSEEDLAENLPLAAEGVDLQEVTSRNVNSTEETASDSVPTISSQPLSFNRKLTELLIPTKDDFSERLHNENSVVESNSKCLHLASPLDDHDRAEKSFAPEQHNNIQDLSDGVEGTKEEIISQEYVFQRINSHKGTKSYQLGRQLSRKWSTGAGPRIGCLRDYPSELQSHALEQVNLSPRNAHLLKSNHSCLFSPPSDEREMQVATSPAPLEKGNLSSITPQSRTQSSPLCKFM